MAESSDRAKESDFVKIVGQSTFSLHGTVILSKEELFSILTSAGYIFGDGYDYEFRVRKKQSSPSYE